MNPTTFAWILVAVGTFLLFVSLGNFDWLHMRERAFSDDYEADSDPTSRGLRQIGTFLLGFVLLVVGGGHLTGKWDLGSLSDESSRREMRELRESVPKPRR